MLRCAIFSIFLTLATVATSIPTVRNDFDEPVEFVDVNSVVQRLQDSAKFQTTFSEQDAFEWKKMFGIQDAIEPEDTSVVADLFSSSKFSVVPSPTVGYSIRYTIGKRVSRDRLVAHGADSKRWSVPQDITLALKYPNSGKGALVTFAEIVVNQSSKVGQAKVIAGGVGQRSITTIVEAKSTLWFGYDVNIYGI